MGNFSRALQHLDMKDVKRKRLKEIAAQKLKEQADAYEKKVIKELSKKYKSDWKREIYEGMTTANALTQTLPASDLENVINDTPTTNADVFADGPARFSTEDNFSYDAMVGTNIKSSGSGSGSDGGFNIGDHVAFDGTGSGDGARWCILKAVDTTKVDFMVIRAIVGNGSNGGETPDDEYEGLMLYYKTSDMDDYIPITYYPSLLTANFKGGSQTIIPVNIGSYGDTLRDYYARIPDYARTKDTRFLLYQFQSTAANRDTYGITNISYRRLTPINVVVPLDDPEAVSFVRVGSDEGDPKKRKKKLNDQLAASDEYTKTVLGNQFPGQGARIDGEDPFKSAPLTPDDVINASPIGKGEVKKSFSSFSADTADATATSEPTESEPTTPSTQATLKPKDENGEEIEVKPVGKIAVQGADAAKLEAEAEAEAEIEPETEPEMKPTSFDEPEPKDEEEKKNWLQRQIDKLADPLVKTLDDIIFKLDDVAGVGDLLGWVSNTFSTAAGGFFQLLNLIPGINIPDYIAGGSTAGKYHNSISIFRSVVSGKVVNHVPTYPELQLFRKFITPDLFEDGSASFVPISSMRHEYADANIYVKGGVVYNNQNGEATDLTVGKYGLGKKFGQLIDYGGTQGPEGIGAHGSGYAQMIIPEDGGEPYLHYFDYNYHNLKNPDDLPLGIGKNQSFNISEVGSNAAHLLRLLTKIPHGGIQRAAATASQKFEDSFKNLGTADSMLGGNWPPGIHGAALTDFKVPLSELPEATQKLIANHPLSWTPERIANMSREDFMTQFGNRSTDRFEFDFAANNYKRYDAFVLKALEDPDSGVDPEFLENYKRFGYAEYDEKTGTHPNAEKGTVEYDYDMAKKELDKIINTPEYSAASEAAFKEYEDILAERDEKIDEIGEKYDTSKLWDKLVGPYYRAVEKIIKSGGSVGDENPTYRKMKEGHKEYEKQRKIFEKKLSVERSALMDEYGKLSDEAIARYNDTNTVRKLDDGTMGLVNGGDFKTKNGKIIKGMDTLSAKQKARFDEVRAEYEEVQEYLRSANWDDNYIKPYVLYDVKTSFGEYGISGDSWSPEKKGSGSETGSSGDNKGSSGDDKTPFDRSFYAGTVDPIVPLGAQSGDKLAGIGGVIGGITAVAAFLGMAADAARTWWKNASPEQRQKIKELINNRQNAHYVPMGDNLLEKYANPNGDNYSLFERLKQKKFFNPKDIKPTFPENPPPQLDPKTGMHPRYGKNANRYKKLDPASANAMPPTGDPETDATVDKQRTKPKTKLYDRLKKNIRKDLTNK